MTLDEKISQMMNAAATIVGGRRPSEKALESGEVLRTELTITGDVNVIE
jgi:hypothetical protein